MISEIKENIEKSAAIIRERISNCDTGNDTYDTRQNYSYTERKI